MEIGLLLAKGEEEREGMSRSKRSGSENRNIKCWQYDRLRERDS